MATYLTKAYKDGNWIGPKSELVIPYAVTIPAQSVAYANGDEVRFQKLRPDLDGLGSTFQVGAAASDGLTVKFLVLNAISAGDPRLKQISTFRTIAYLRNESDFFTAGTVATTMYAHFDNKDNCIATSSSGTGPAGTVKTVNWPALPYVAAVIATAAAAGVVSVATANTFPMLPITLGRRMGTTEFGNNIVRYYPYNATQKIQGNAGKQNPVPN